MLFLFLIIFSWMLQQSWFLLCLLSNALCSPVWAYTDSVLLLEIRWFHMSIFIFFKMFLRSFFIIVIAVLLTFLFVILYTVIAILSYFLCKLFEDIVPPWNFRYHNINKRINNLCRHWIKLGKELNLNVLCRRHETIINMPMVRDLIKWES